MVLFSPRINYHIYYTLYSLSVFSLAKSLQLFFGNQCSLQMLLNCFYFSLYCGLQCRRILGERNLVRVRNIVVAATFDFMTVEDWGE